MRKFLSMTISVVACLMFLVGGVRSAELPERLNVEPSVYFIRNGSFEDGSYDMAAYPEYWTTAAASHSAVFSWENTQAYAGSKSVKISANQPDDAYWGQSIPVMPHTDYLLSGYIKTENVEHSAESIDMGANLSLWGSWDEHSQPLLGTNDWTYVSFTFNSGERLQITVAARLGYWSGMTTGTAWFDELQLAQLSTPTKCEPTYPEGYFRACYYQGKDPYTGAMLGSDDESPLGSPVPKRAFGINHDWGVWNAGDVSAIWRGRIYFEAGRYQFTTFAWEGVRLFIGEELLIDEWDPYSNWYRYGTVVELKSGYYNIRVEWNTTGSPKQPAQLLLHWDRVPDAPLPHRVTPMVIDVFLLEKQDICIVGDLWESGDSVAIYNPDDTVYRTWQRDDQNGLPRTLSPSDPSLSNYAQVECFSFGYMPDEIPQLLEEVDKFAGLIRNWSGGDIQPEIRMFTIEGEVGLGRIGGSWWIPPWEIASVTAPLMTTESDFAIVLSSNDDILTRRYYPVFGCGATFGVAAYTAGGTGYSWVTCVDSMTILHEWEHQFSGAINNLLQFESIYPVDLTSYPPCGMGDPDIFKWFPDSHDWGTDPDSPWCGPTEVVGTAELHLFAHFDSSLSHYPLGYFTGNHCNNGILDFEESEVDKGSNCPVEAAEETVEKQPTDDAWIQVKASANHGEDPQLKIQKTSKVAFLKFDLQDVEGEITAAYLVAKTVKAKESVVSVHAVADTAWQEETLNGKNAPTVGEELGSAGVGGSGEVLQWDVTGIVASAVEGNEEAVSFALVVKNGKQLAISSKEGKESTDAPFLVIIYKPTPASAPSSQMTPQPSGFTHLVYMPILEDVR